MNKKLLAYVTSATPGEINSLRAALLTAQAQLQRHGHNHAADYVYLAAIRPLLNWQRDMEARKARGAIKSPLED